MWIHPAFPYLLNFDVITLPVVIKPSHKVASKESPTYQSPTARKKHLVKSTTKDNAYEDVSILSDTDSVDSVCDQTAMPRDTTATDKLHNSQGNTKVNTQDQDLSTTRQPKQHRTSQPTETSPSRPILSSQDTHNHKKQHITGPLSAKYNTGPPPLPPKATTSRPQHTASSKQQPALLPTPVPLKVTIHSKQQTVTTCTITHIQLFHKPSLLWSSHQVTSPYTAIPSSHHININWQIHQDVVPTKIPRHNSSETVCT